MSDPKDKEKALTGLLEKIPSCVIAFSGGLDSAFLSVIAKAHVPGRVICVTVVAPSTPECDLESARGVAARHGLEHMLVESGIEPEVRANPRDRCYHCKFGLFRILEVIRAGEGLAVILDGENSSDASDHRPGSRAARECGIVTPLARAGLTKRDIRALARETGLDIWDRPASACLSSRISFGTPLEEEVLGRVDKTEDFIRSKGIRMIRARAQGPGTRLELGQDENTQENREMLENLAGEIKKFGWDSVILDPAGYIPAGLRQKNDRQ